MLEFTIIYISVSIIIVIVLSVGVGSRLSIWLILLCGKPSQSLLIHIYPQRVHPRHSHIDPQIKFQPIHQQGVAYIMGHNQRRVLLQFAQYGIHGGSHSDALPLRHVMRFDDIRVRRAVVLFFELLELLGEDVGFGQEVEI